MEQNKYVKVSQVRKSLEMLGRHFPNEAREWYHDDPRMEISEESKKQLEAAKGGSLGY